MDPDYRVSELARYIRSLGPLRAAEPSRRGCLIALPDLAVQPQDVYKFPSFILDLRQDQATSTVRVHVGIKNIGPVRAAAFNVIADARVEFLRSPPGAGPVPFVVRATGFPRQTRFDHLDPNQDVIWQIDRPIEVPNGGWLVRVVVEIAADPPTPGNPGGEIWECDETNNFDTYEQEVNII